VATLSKIATVYTGLVLTRPEGRFLQYSGIPGIFSGGGLASALLHFDWPASATSLPQMAFLAGLLLLVAVMNGGTGIGELAGARRALGF
jgi:RsiW-degrading membrane proteinase PrsW (M82 family)